MKFTLSWLKDHLETEAGLDAIVERLTAIGLEVEGVSDPAAALAPFRVARVLAAERHPQADKLQVLSVDAGDGPVQVVCGAPNARAGLVGVFAAPGAYVPGSDLTLAVATIRGVESRGMMCSARELELGQDHDGIIELPADAPVGAAYAAWAGLDDPVIEVSVTPNRQDCMGVRGIARDLAAAGLGTLKPLSVPQAPDNGVPELVESLPFSSAKLKVEEERPSASAGKSELGNGPDVRTDDPEGCPAFFAQNVNGVRNGASPDWIARRLTAIGQKPISALVDITNYVMIDLGRPLHVYDRARLKGGLVARRARNGESVAALNGKTYALTPDMTVIADEAAVHDIGGIMGGEHSGVSESTTDVLIECAYFTPERIARTGQALGLTSDARSRFERGVDPTFLDDGLAVATRLVTEICGGKASAVTRSGEPPLEVTRLAYRPETVEQLAGVTVTSERQQAILESLGFTVARGSPLHVVPPSWRRDVAGSADIVEEVVRIVGLNQVPSTPLPRPPGVAKPTATPEQKVERRVRRAAAARGLNEAVTWSFLSAREATAFGGGAWSLANPISEELKVMRPSLLPGLLAAAGRNRARGASAIRLFEIGRRYLADAERLTLGFVLAGDKIERGWASGKAAGFDAYDAKAEALALLAAADAPIDNLQSFGEAGAWFHPGQSATLRLGPKTVLAAYGVLHPSTAKAFELDGAVVAGELYLDALPARRAAGPARAAYAPPALQAVTRDFAFLAPAELPAEQLVRAVRGADKAAIVAARLFDVFTGAGVHEGHKSVAIEVTLQPGAKSFTDEELTGISARVVAAAEKLGATLRT